jgi:F0F1-type ATP synthase assembly protein I
MSIEAAAEAEAEAEAAVEAEAEAEAESAEAAAEAEAEAEAPAAEAGALAAAVGAVLISLLSASIPSSPLFPIIIAIVGIIIVAAVMAGGFAIPKLLKITGSTLLVVDSRVSSLRSDPPPPLFRPTPPRTLLYPCFSPQPPPPPPLPWLLPAPKNRSASKVSFDCISEIYCVETSLVRLVSPATTL